MAINLNRITGDLRAIGNRVLVRDMHFGEQRTKSGLILRDDDGQTRGIYPRWGRVYDKGPENKDNYQVGDWVLVEHGRWTRGIDMDINGENVTLRMVEAESILASSDEKPDGVSFGEEIDTSATSHRPEDFVRT